MAERETAEELVQHLIRLSDECSYAVKAKASALFGLAEMAFIEGKQAGGATSAVIGLKQVALETEEDAAELHERVDEALAIARRLARGDVGEEQKSEEAQRLAGEADHG